MRGGRFLGGGCFLPADGPALLFAGRVGQALALGAAQSLIVRHRSAAARIGGPLLVSLAFAGGTVLGPAVSGALARYAPGPLVTPFVLHLLLLVWVWAGLGQEVPPTRLGARRWRPARPHIPAVLRPLLLVAGLNGFLAGAVVGVYLAFVPALLERSLRSDNPELSGGVLAAVLGRSVGHLPTGRGPLECLEHTAPRPRRAHREPASAAS